VRGAGGIHTTAVARRTPPPRVAVAISITVAALALPTAVAGPASARQPTSALSGGGAAPISVSAATHPNHDGVLSTTVDGEGTGSILVAMLSVAARGPGAPPSLRLHAPSPAGLRWRLPSITSAAGATVGIWQATLGPGQRVDVRTRIPRHSTQALLAVAQFPAGTRIVGGPGAGQDGRGLPSFRVPAAAGEQVLAVGHAWLGAHALRPSSGQTVLAHLRMPVQQTWVQTLAATRTGSARLADTGASTRGWVLSGFAVRPPPSTTTADR
jgi:hypothetical protein